MFFSAFYLLVPSLRALIILAYSHYISYMYSVNIKKIFTLITLFSMGVANSDEYIWTGNANDGLWTNPGNWNPNDDFPNGIKDSAIIEDRTEPLTVTWPQDNSGSIAISGVGSISLGKNVTLILDLDGTSQELRRSYSSLYLAGNSKLAITNAATIELHNDVTVDYGNFGYGNSGLLDYTGNNRVWGNHHTYSLKGTLDASSFSSVAAGETVTIDLVKVDLGTASNAAGNQNIYFNTAGLTLADSATLVEVNEGSLRGISITYTAPSIPEPTTGTLSLLALAGLLTRRRR